MQGILRITDPTDMSEHELGLGQFKRNSDILADEESELMTSTV